MTSMYELHVRYILTSLSAMDVTTTSARQGKFEARFYHKIFAEEIGRVRGHFGPLNYVAVHPQGTSYCSGGEDGYVRVHHFDKPYFDFLYEVEREAAQANL
jgi:translation initiation factor 3 subunit I